MVQNLGLSDCLSNYSYDIIREELYDDMQEEILFNLRLKQTNPVTGWKELVNNLKQLVPCYSEKPSGNPELDFLKKFNYYDKMIDSNYLNQFLDMNFKEIQLVNL